MVVRHGGENIARRVGHGAVKYDNIPQITISNILRDSEEIEAYAD